MAHALKLGDKVRFQHPHLFEVVYFMAKVVKLDGEYVWLEVPERIRRLPFPPVSGKRYMKYLGSALNGKVVNS